MNNFISSQINIISPKQMQILEDEFTGGDLTEISGCWTPVCAQLRALIDAKMRKTVLEKLSTVHISNVKGFVSYAVDHKIPSTASTFSLGEYTFEEIKGSLLPSEKFSKKIGHIVDMMSKLEGYVTELQQMQKTKKFSEKKISRLTTNLDRLIQWSLKCYEKAKNAETKLKEEKSNLFKCAKTASKDTLNSLTANIQTNADQIVEKYVCSKIYLLAFNQFQTAAYCLIGMHPASKSDPSLEPMRQAFQLYKENQTTSIHA